VKKIYLLILLAFLAGCSDIPTRSVKDNDVERQKQREQIHSWNLNGRLSLTSEKESGTVTFYWAQDQERYLMRFIAPLGRGTYALRGGEGNGVYLLTTKNEVLRADDAESLLKQSVGWHVPISGFKFWVRGLPEPGVDLGDQQFDDQGRVVEMQQADWHISIKRYMDADGVDLPAKIFMQNDIFKVKLIVQSWDTTP
jgi:outer membrane lipoprotein LolB